MAENVPVTIYRDTSGLTEYNNIGTNYIVDTLDNNVADPSGNLIVDTGVVATPIPATVWEEDDSK